GLSRAEARKSNAADEEQRDPIHIVLYSRMVILWKTGKYFQPSPPFLLFLSGLTAGHSTGSWRTSGSRSPSTNSSTTRWSRPARRWFRKVGSTRTLPSP